MLTTGCGKRVTSGRATHLCPGNAAIIAVFIFNISIDYYFLQSVYRGVVRNDI